MTTGGSTEKVLREWPDRINKAERLYIQSTRNNSNEMPKSQVPVQGQANTIGKEPSIKPPGQTAQTIVSKMNQMGLKEQNGDKNLTRLFIN